MIRVLIFFALMFLVAMGFAWMADLPGVVSISWQGYVWEKPPVVAAFVGGLGLVLFLVAIWLLLAVLRSPKIATRFFKRRRKDKGYEALSQGLIALGTGNAKLARRHGLDADKLLNEEPAAKLLLAQTAQLAGKDDEARSRFEAMLETSDTRALGLHGLFVEAERHNEPVAARHYAEEANKLVPGLEWAGKAVLGYQAVASHWEQALTTLERNYAAKLIDKKNYRRQRAVVLTALAQNLEIGEPERSISLAKEAHGLALDLVPAAVIASRLATRRGDVRKAIKLIETTWRLSPHPDLAETYAHVRSGDSAVDRLKRVKALAGLRANTSVGALAVARAALEAREFDEARGQLKKILRSEPMRAAFLMMAELEEAEHGDKGRMRDWLARAVRAPLDKAWVADGIVSAEWQPVSPVTGKLDAFEWVTPSGLPDPDIGDVIEDAMFDAPALASISTLPEDPMVIEPVEKLPAAPMQMPDSDEIGGKSATAKGSDIDETAAKEPAEHPTPASVDARMGVEGTTDDVKVSPSVHELPDTQDADKAAEDSNSAKGLAGEPSAPEPPAPESPTPEPPASEPDDKVKMAGDTPDSAATDAGQKSDQDLDKPIAFPFTRMPDDPGPDEDDDKPKETRPRFFN